MVDQTPNLKLIFPKKPSLGNPDNLYCGFMNTVDICFIKLMYAYKRFAGKNLEILCIKKLLLPQQFYQTIKISISFLNNLAIQLFFFFFFLFFLIE